jgi:hypothetical protein
MNEAFMTKEFTVPEISRKLGIKNNPILNISPLSKDEAKRLLLLLKQQVFKKGHICNNCKIYFILGFSLTDKFVNRTSSLLATRFRDMLLFIFRRLNIFFGDPYE